MICGRDKIIELLDEGNAFNDRIEINIDDKNAADFDRDTQVGNDSIDIRIGRKGYKIACNYDFINTMDQNVDQYFFDINIGDEGYIIYPGETIIVGSVERVKLSGKIIGELTARTRFARMGLSVCCATKFQSYSDAVVCFQITNLNRVPLKIFPYQKLAQLIIHTIADLPNNVRGNYANETELRRPIITKKEYSGLTDDSIKSIQRQRPSVLADKTRDGNDDFKPRIRKNNKTMTVISKIFKCLSAILSMLISIFLGIGIGSSDQTIIIILGVVITLLVVITF